MVAAGGMRYAPTLGASVYACRLFASTNSTKTPPVDLGWTKAIRPCDVSRGAVSISSTPVI